jgi:hypothetical protein
MLEGIQIKRRRQAVEEKRDKIIEVKESMMKPKL